MSIKFIPVQGTWGWGGDRDKHEQWWKPGSPWVKFMQEHDFELFDPKDPFVWSSDADGTIFETLTGRWNHADWEAGGHALAWYLKDVPYQDRNLIAHSHGGQVAAYAATLIPVYHLLTVATPSRKDMASVYTMARQNIGQWTHIYSDMSDLWQVAGSLFDGRFGVHRKIEAADLNIMVPHVGHANMLRDPRYFQQLVDAGVLDLLRFDPPHRS